MTGGVHGLNALKGERERGKKGEFIRQCSGHDVAVTSGTANQGWRRRNLTGKDKGQQLRCDLKMQDSCGREKVGLVWASQQISYLQGLPSMQIAQTHSKASELLITTLLLFLSCGKEGWALWDTLWPHNSLKWITFLILYTILILQHQVAISASFVRKKRLEGVSLLLGNIPYPFWKFKAECFSYWG